MTTSHTFARRVFRIAAIYGILVLAPQYFLEERLAIDFPPPLTHPEHFYGFIGIALAWQFVFLLIASDMPRYRPLMLVAVLEKLAFGVPAWMLYLQGRAAAPVVAAGSVDLVLGALFVAAFLSTRERSPGK
jgi:hypothetical protein